MHRGSEWGAHGGDCRGRRCQRKRSGGCGDAGGSGSKYTLTGPQTGAATNVGYLGAIWR